MPAFRAGRVTARVEERPDLLRLRVELDGTEVDAIGFPAALGPVEEGDRVILNTTGIELGLGTGGVAFVLWDLDGPGPPEPGRGHIVKMRYTPWQTEVLAAEAPESPYHDRLRDLRTIDGMPVVACALHSQVAGVVAGIKAEAPDARVGYLMTDGGALPIAWSGLVTALGAAGLISTTCTAGHAFGGELEAVNELSGLAVLRAAAGCDVVVAGMGPGVVGTGTALGTTALEQGRLVDAAGALGGRAVACLRISFADDRARHRGISHHCLTALQLAARPCTIAVPALPARRAAEVGEQLARSALGDRHRIVTVDGRPGVEFLDRAGIRPSSMGRRFEAVPELWLAAAAAGRLAAAALRP